MKESQRLAQSLTSSKDGAESVGYASTISGQAGVKLDVYERLSIRGRVVAEKRRHWTPPPVEAPFSPTITSKSAELARRYRERQSSASESPGPGLRRSHSNSSFSHKGGIDNQSVSSSRQPLFVSGNMSIASAGQRRAVSHSPMRSLEDRYNEDRVPERVRKELERSRSRSQSRTRETDKDRAMREYLITNVEHK